MSPEREQLLCDALVNPGPREIEQGLHAEGVRKIQRGPALHPGRRTDNAPRALRVRKRIEETAIPIEELDQPRFRWVQPSA